MIRVTRRWAFATVGLAAGFSGLAVIATILTGVSLLLLELALVAVVAAGVTVILRRTSRPIVHEVAVVARAGLIAGAFATLVYDVTRTVLSVFDPSPYNPFEAVRHFGIGLLGTDAPYWALLVTGLMIHFLNGSTFGVIYAVFAGRHVRTTRGAIVSGILWGLTLELVQSILYPGWLGITTVLREFLVISGLGHFAYGVTLGIGTRRLLRNHPPPEDPT